MKLEQLTKVITRSGKRLGRGLGSGRGKTSGRGTKGQKARGKVRLGFIGGGLPLYRKLPMRRGHKNSVVSEKPKTIKLSQLNTFKSGSVIDFESLLNNKIVTKKDLKKGVKILGLGEITKELVIKIPISESAKQKILQLGGKVENV